MTQPVPQSIDTNIFSSTNWKIFLDTSGHPAALITLQGQILHVNKLLEKSHSRDVFTQMVTTDKQLLGAIEESMRTGSAQVAMLSLPVITEVHVTPLNGAECCILIFKQYHLQKCLPVSTAIIHFGVSNGLLSGASNMNIAGSELFQTYNEQLTALAGEIFQSLLKHGAYCTVVSIDSPNVPEPKFLAEASLIGNQDFGFLCLSLCLVASANTNTHLIQAIDNSASAFFLADRSGTIIYANNALLTTDLHKKGYTSLPKLKELRYSALTGESDASFWATLQAGHPWEGELAFPLNPKQILWRLFSVSPTEDNLNNTYYIGIEHTAQEIYSVLLKLHQHYNFLDSILDALPQPFTVYNVPNYATIHANKASKHFLGRLRCKIDKTETKPYCLACHNSPVNYCLLEQCYQTKLPVIEEFEMQENGDTKYYSLSIFPVLENSAVKAIIEIANDITDHKKRGLAQMQDEEYIREVSMQKTLLQSVINSIPDHIFYKDISGNYLGSNSAFLALAGMSAVEGKKDFDLFPKELAYYFSLQDQLVLKKSIPARSERWVQFPTGQRVLLDTLRVPFMFQNRTVGVIGISRDITDLKRIENELHEQKERIQAHNREIAAQRDELELQRDHVCRQNLEITQSINYALRIQNAVLPQREDVNLVLNDYFIYFKPRNIVSGDFYWFARKGNVALVAAADCTGHGVPGALMSILGVAFLKQIVSNMEHLDSGEILNQLRRHIIMSLHQTGRDGETSDGLDIALYTVDYSSMELCFSGAYNPLYLVRGNTFTEYRADKMPISLHAIKSGFSTTRVSLQKGDAVYVFSDGFADQFGGNSGKKLKTNGFKSLIQSCAASPMTEQEDMFRNFFESWKGDHEQVDDILVIGARF